MLSDFRYFAAAIVAFSGSYHGIVDEVIVRGSKKFKSYPAAPGIMPEAVQNMLILDYGTDESLRIIKERTHDLAAVLVEPVQSRRPEFQPIDFLKKLRTITEDAGTCLECHTSLERGSETFRGSQRQC